MYASTYIYTPTCIVYIVHCTLYIACTSYGQHVANRTQDRLVQRTRVDVADKYSQMSVARIVRLIAESGHVYALVSQSRCARAIDEVRSERVMRA